MIIWERHNVKHVLQVGTYKTKQLIKKLTLWLLHFLPFISNLGDADQPQMGTRKVKAMTLGLRRCGRVAKADKHQVPNAANYKVNAIGKCKKNIREDTCCGGKNWRLLSMTGQLVDVKGFHNSYEAITNVTVGRAATAVVHDDGTVYILVLNYSLSFGKLMDHLIINPN